MIKKILIFSFTVMSLTSAYADDYPPPPNDPGMPLVRMKPLEFQKAPEHSKFLSKTEMNTLNNINDYINSNYNYNNNTIPITKNNYSIDLKSNKKNRLLKVIQDMIDKKENFYQVLGIKYNIKYSRQCPIDFKNNGTLDKDICHDTYQQYLEKDKKYNELQNFNNELSKYQFKSQQWQDFLHTRYKDWYEYLNILNNTQPTFWHDTLYFVPDNIYLTQKYKDLIILSPNNILINTLNICIKEKDVNDYFSKTINSKEKEYNFNIIYKNIKIIFDKNYINHCVYHINTGDDSYE